MKLRLAVGVVAVGWMSGCGNAPAPEEAGPKKFPGVALQFSVAQGSPLADALRLRIPEWEQRTGAKVTLAEAATPDAAADLAACNGAELLDLADRLPFARDVQKDPSIGFINVPYLHQTAFGARREQPVALPLGVEVLVLWYRADLFADAALGKQFAGDRGRPLAVPKTWEEYGEVAEFFQKKQATEFGCVEATTGGPWTTRGFLARGAGYSADSRLFPLDIADGAPLVAEPPAVRALERLRAASQWSPAAKGPVTDEQARKTFATGKAAMLLSTIPPTVGTSVPAGFADKIGVAPLPVGAEVYDYKSKTWSKNPMKEPAPFVGSSGHFLSMSAKSQHPEATLALFAFLCDDREDAYLVQGARRGLAPARESLLNDSGRFGGYGLPSKPLADYFSLVRDSLRPRRWATDFRVSSAGEFRGALESALASKRPPAEALAEVAKSWQALVAKRGPDFLDEYRLALGFSRVPR